MKNLEIPDGFWLQRAAELAWLRTQREEQRKAAAAARVRYAKRGERHPRGKPPRYHKTFCELQFHLHDETEGRLRRLIYARGGGPSKAARNIVWAITNLWWKHQHDDFLYLKRVGLPSEADIFIRMDKEMTTPELLEERPEDLMVLLKSFGLIVAAFLEANVPVEDIQDQVAEVARSMEQMDRELEQAERQRGYDMEYKKRKSAERKQQ